MNKLFIIFSVLFFTIICGSVSSVRIDMVNMYDIGSKYFDYTPFINAVNLTSIKRHIEFFSSLGTRATGYPENELAAQYIYEKFIEYGLINVSYQTFEVVDCISYGANITIISTGECIDIHPLIPNLICPSTKIGIQES